MQINGIELITDRSQSDVAVVKSLVKKTFEKMTNEEKEAFLSGLKGAYNYTDFNRVESIVEYLVKRFSDVPEEIQQYAKSLGVAWDKIFDLEYSVSQVNNIETKTDWKMSDTLTLADRRRYIQNIIRVVGTIENVENDFPRSLDKMNYAQANLIERKLKSVDDGLKTMKENKETMITNTAKAWFYSGDIYGGEIL